MERKENSEFGNKDRYEKALEFVAAAGSLPYENFCRLAVRNSDALIEMLQGNPESLEFLASKQIGHKAVAADIKEILHKLHFNPEDDYYLALLLPANADQSGINRRWKELMRIYHPDKQSDRDILSSEGAAQCAKRVNEIYNVLKDPMKKFGYDQHLANPAGNGNERPSVFSKPEAGNSLLRNARKYSFAVLFFVVMAAIVAAAVLYSGKPDFKSNPPRNPATPTQTDTAVQKTEVLAKNEAPAEHQQIRKAQLHPQVKKKAAKRYRKKAVKKPVSAAPHHYASLKKAPVAARKPAIPVEKKPVQAVKAPDDVALADEVSDFIERLVQAYEDGNLNAYLSFYSTSAVEDDCRTYGDLREFYGNLFDKGRYSYSIRNMVIREENGIIEVKGNFVSKRLPEAANNPAEKGTISMSLVRECGDLKIIKSNKVLNEQS